MKTYYLVTVDGVPGYDSGEILRKCYAKTKRQAERKLGITENNCHLVEVITASKLYNNMYDPNLLRS